MIIEPKSLERSDVANALNSAQPGDTVVLPEGRAAWDQGFEWYAPPDTQLVTKAIVSGADVPVGGAGSLIEDRISRGGFDAALLQIVPQGPFRFAGLAVQSLGDPSYNGMVRLFGGSPRVDHVSFSGGVTGLLFGSLTGLCDSSVFKYSAIRHFGEGFGDAAWAEPDGFGTDQFVFVEDCILESDGGSMDSYMGSRWVYRYNRFINGGVQTHPTGGSGRARGTRAYELYKNQFDATKNNFNVFFISSGTGAIWGNTVQPASYGNFLTLHAMRRGPASSHYPQFPPPSGWGYAGKSVDGRGSYWDGNENEATGRPNIDQPGRGRGDRLDKDFPEAYNTATGVRGDQPGANPRQQHSPIYEWENSWIGSGGGSKVAIYEPDVIIPGVDVISDVAMPGYSPYVYPHPARGGVIPTPNPEKKTVKISFTGTLELQISIKPE